MFKINLQMFANIDEIVEQHAKELEGLNVKDNFSTLAGKFGELGYDILINNKKSAEFVPSSRLSEVVGQRDGFKSKLDAQNVELENLKKSAGDNQAFKDQVQSLIDKNTTLLKDLETTKVNTEIMLAAKDAVNPKDLLAFINMDSIKMNAKGEILGVDAEVERLKKEKPYLFTASGIQRRGGTDPNSGTDNNKPVGMNAMIRRAAGRNTK